MALRCRQAAIELRRTISLNGTWEIAEGAMDKPPAAFDRKIPVPGLVDMASPAFVDVGLKSDMREPSGTAGLSASRAQFRTWRGSRCTRRCSARAWS